MASLKTIFDALSRVDGLTDALSIPNLIQFVQLTSLLKNEIIALLSSTHNLAESPDTLPGDIQVFLSASLGLSKKFIDGAWAALREICWEYSTGEAADTLKLHFMAHGLNRSFTEQMLFPPSQTCQTPNCVKRHKLLKRTLVQKVVLYTLNGAKPGIVSQFHCDSCRTSFHVNYSVYKGMRTYYEGIPGVIEVAEHHYIETKVLELFTTLMLVSWTSATNGARIYNTALANSDQWPDHPDWKDKSIELRNEYVWDGFVALALLRECKRQSPPAVLCVPNTGTQNSRFDQAMKARNAWIHRFGQPEYAHYCDKCFRGNNGGSGQPSQDNVL
ncbi:hypothetical protein C8J56DRAFT_1157215 [Mycena floridula]|nr:hypothetical protein C8J56DRAFT_1157215 [Mycena floridula]